MVLSAFIILLTVNMASAKVTDRNDALKTITSKEGIWGVWDEFIYCNPGHYASGFQLGSYMNIFALDQSGAQYFKLKCNDGEIIEASNNSPLANMMEAKDCPSQTLLKGFKTKAQAPQGPGIDDFALTSVRGYCSDNTEIEPTFESFFGGTWDAEPRRCDFGSSVCGFRQRVELDLDSGDFTALNAIQLKCCKDAIDATEEPKYNFAVTSGGWKAIYQCSGCNKVEHEVSVGITNIVSSTQSTTQSATEQLEKSRTEGSNWEVGLKASVEAWVVSVEASASMGGSSQISKTQSSSISSSVMTSVTETKETTITTTQKLECGKDVIWQFQMDISQSYGEQTASFTLQPSIYACVDIKITPKCFPSLCCDDDCQICKNDENQCPGGSRRLIGRLLSQ